MQQTSGNPAMRYGLIFGAFVAVLSIADQALTTATQQNVLGAARGVLAVGCLLFLVYLALYFVSGMLTARQTGTVGSGTIAGLVAGVVGGVIGGAIALVIKLASPDGLATAANLGGPGFRMNQNTLVVIAIAGFVIGALFQAGLGAGLGALGALAGRGSNQPRGPQYQEAMYPGTYPGAGAVPPYGGYSGQPGMYPPPAGAYPPPPGAYPPPAQGSWPQTPPPPAQGSWPQTPPAPDGPPQTPPPTEQ